MGFLKEIRTQLINKLWDAYRNSIAQVKYIEHALLQRDEKIVLDHFAIIDIPGKNSGIPTLCQIFSALGYTVQGHDYLPDKQNEFLWLAEIDAIGQPAQNVLPQVVVADFWLDELPVSVKTIVERYAAQTSKLSLRHIQHLSGKAFLGDKQAATQLLEALVQYFSGRDWPLPTVKDFQIIHEANELLAWTLVFGRIPNHFTVSVHLLNSFKSLMDFNNFITDDLKLKLNDNGEIIKGDPAMGLVQSSTVGEATSVLLADGQVTIPERFIEFIWRYPHNNLNHWDSYYTGFIANNANRVIESLYADNRI